MKKLPINKLKSIKTCVCALCALAFTLLLLPARANCSVRAATVSAGECVVEVSSRRILHGVNERTALPMASTTKVMTAIVVIDDCDLDETVTVPPEAQGIEGSSVYLRAGDTYTVRDLLYGLMLRSGNDCAVTLALHHSGSIRKFADAMNAKALMLGAEHSHFVNPHGLPNDEHYTTALDLALISAYAAHNETFREIVSCKHYAPRGWSNKNKLLTDYEGAFGIKTGFTMKAGRCLVSAAERDGMALVCVVLNSPQMFERSEELLDRTFQTYRPVRLCSAQEAYGGFACRSDFVYPLSAEEERKIVKTTELFAPAPAASGEFAGVMKIYLENHLLFSQNLYMI